jgi:hypothetical protein
MNTVNDLERRATVLVRVDALRPADSPRLDGESPEHARVLSESAEDLPPILVHRPSMRVVDGMHRLRAAKLRGQREIEVRYFAGCAEDAFVAAVEANTAHGLPLSLADRTAAAERILRSHADWSDRAIASVTGIAAKTVGAIRKRATGDIAQSHERVGRDGRVRPVDATRGRLLAVELIRANPEASLRQIGRAANISTGTVRDVRARLLRGDDPLPDRQRHADRRDRPRVRPAGDATPETGEPMRIEVGRRLLSLRNDPSLRFTEGGRLLLRLLDFCAVDSSRLDRLTENVPPHCADLLAEVAEECGRAWSGFATQVRQRLLTSA